MLTKSDKSTIFIKLDFNEDLKKMLETCYFIADYLEPKDQGIGYLVILDINQNDNSLLTTNYATRLELLKNLLNDPKLFNQESSSNQYRVRLPTLYEDNDIIYVFNTILPNYYGYVYGVNFINDKITEVITKNVATIKDSYFLLEKTKYPDVMHKFKNFYF